MVQDQAATIKMKLQGLAITNGSRCAHAVDRHVHNNSEKKMLVPFITMPFFECVSVSNRPRYPKKRQPATSSELAIRFFVDFVLTVVRSMLPIFIQVIEIQIQTVMAVVSTVTPIRERQSLSLPASAIKRVSQANANT